MATTPGFHIDTKFDLYPANVHRAISAISKNFYVTRSFNSETIGNSKYWALLARPADDFSVHLNADRELLCVFSAYETFEIRTLEAFDLFYSQLEQKRVDRSIRFLISSDPRIEDIIKHYLNQNPEYPIIIPVYLPNIDREGAHLLDAIRRNYLLRDLFGYQNPLREETFFFGRQKVVNEILDLAKSGQSSSLFGLRKSGKTSIIYAIMRRAKSFGSTPIFIDCQNPAVHARRYNELLAHIMELIRNAVGQKRKKLEFLGSDVEVAEQFRAQLKSLLGQSKTNILLIFDEIENISPKTAASQHWDQEKDSLLFWQNLRSFIQEDASGRVSICLVGTSPLLIEQAKFGNVPNPMYLYSQKRFLQSLSFAETKEMIDRLGFFMGIHLDPTQVAKLQALYGGHPFFVRQVCSNIHQLASSIRPITISNRLLEQAIEKFGSQLDAYLRDILDSLRDFYPGEFELLKSIVSGDLAEISEYGNDVPDLIDHLIGYGLVERKGDDFDIRFSAVKTALSNIIIPGGIDEIWKEFASRRSNIETDIRRELLSFSRNLSSGEWDALLTTQLSKVRYDALNSVEPRLLFSKAGSPLYWTDLMALLKSNDVLKFLGDRRPEVLSSMNTVNFKGRIDSHAKHPMAGDIDAVRDAFNVLELEFSQPD